jgi:hypothetical protein
MRVYLKIKVKSLAAEAAIIRKEENRCRQGQARAKAKDNMGAYDSIREQRLGLADHRRFAVRPESRSAGIAYGYLKGRSYAQMELWCHEAPDFKRIEYFVDKYGEGDKRDRMQQFAEWLEAAQAHLATQTKPVFERKPKPPYVPKAA